jgi:large subunit ribosomal protein L23
MQAIHVIKRPLITEKSTWESGDRNRYSFEVDAGARKSAIKAAIEELYNVRVVRVATQNRKGKARRTRFGVSRTPDWKRATVQLHEDDKIELF